MELSLCCRFCYRVLSHERSVRRHEAAIHEREYHANHKKKTEPDLSLYRKCKFCSIYTLVNESEIISHGQSQHHKRAVSAVQAVNVESSSSAVSSPPVPASAIPVRPVPKLFGWRAAQEAAKAREATSAPPALDDAEDGMSYGAQERSEDENAEHESADSSFSAPRRDGRVVLFLVFLFRNAQSISTSVP